MFTGIVEEIGVLRRAEKRGEAMVLTIGASRVLEDAALGDSIAVNGVCLTVTRFDSASVTMDVMPETYRNTNLKDLRPGDGVNLERAMRADRRFGGHIVQGHVDGVGTIVQRTPEGNAVRFRIRPDDTSLLRWMVPRGSIAVDGISLTLVTVEDDAFTVSIIPHTLRETVLKDKHPGSTVNLETDVTGKYIYRYLETILAARPEAVPRPRGAENPRGGGITREWLEQFGFS
jgi:riboflavin synthase